MLLAAAVIGGLAAVGGLLVPPEQTHHPLETEFKRLSSDAQQLRRDIQHRTESLIALKSQFIKTLEELDLRLRETTDSELKLQKQLSDEKVILIKYAEFMEKGNGVVLADGRSIPPEEVKRQFAFEEHRRDHLQERLDLLAQHREAAERVCRSARARHDKVMTQLAKLSEANRQLEVQIAQLDLVLQPLSNPEPPDSTAESDLRRLESKITSIQDQIGAYLQDVPDNLILQPH